MKSLSAPERSRNSGGAKARDLLILWLLTLVSWGLSRLSSESVGRQRPCGVRGCARAPLLLQVAAVGLLVTLHFHNFTVSVNGVEVPFGLMKTLSALVIHWFCGSQPDTCVNPHCKNFQNHTSVIGVTGC